jgi:superfamily II DNA/RNA helicase
MFTHSQAPTGSGKTVLFELAIIRMLRQAKESGESAKCVYMAPTKVRSVPAVSNVHSFVLAGSLF